MINSSDILGSLRTKIESYLRQKELSYEVNSDGKYGLRQGSTKVFIAPAMWNDNQTIVRIFAPVSVEITRISPELTRFLVEENNNLLFGKFSLDSGLKTVWYENNLLGNFLDVEELFVGIVTVAITADKYDEQVSGMAGGKRYVDI